MKHLLAIETSCDDTSAAVLDPGGRVLSSVVASQDLIHARYGGVVPELASRQHLTNLPAVVAAALEQAGIAKGDLDRVAVTCGPGLQGSLLVGVSYAKAFAWGLGLPLVAVNHVEGHLRSPWMEDPSLPYPALGLVVSGGHSSLFYSESPASSRLVAATRDDAAGEALDKLGKRLRLPYPAGPVMDRLSSRGNPKAVPFALPRMSSGSADYSFSGLKTAALHYMKTNGLEVAAGASPEELPQWAYDLIASYQKRIVDHLIQVTKRAALALRPACITMAGGVACNRLLRERLTGLGLDLGIPAAFPSPRYCTDNAAMIGFLALNRDPAPSLAGVDAFPTALWPRMSLEEGPCLPS